MKELKSFYIGFVLTFFVLTFLSFKFNSGSLVKSAGEYTKGLGEGKFDVAVSSTSTMPVKVFSNKGKFWVDWDGFHYFSGYKDVQEITPGNHATVIDMGDALFQVNERPFIEASDVEGGVDLHFENCWIAVRSEH